MNEFNKSQALVLFVITLLLIITPFLPSSLKPTYLYFIFNLLIIALGAEAGFLSAFPRPLEDKKFSISTSTSVVTIPEEREASTSTSGSYVSELNEKKPKIVVEKPVSEKYEKVKKCPSMRSVYFVGVGEVEAEAEKENNMEEEVESEDEVGGINRQELFAKAEAFIGNFYRQMKMQRD